MALWQPCAFEISQHMALTAPSANRPTSPTGPTSPTFFARSIGIAQSAPASQQAFFLCFPVNFSKKLEK